MSYTDVFGGANIYPSEITYRAIALISTVQLSWPEETSSSDNLAARIMDVTPLLAGLSIKLPAANKTGNGQTLLFNNRGANSFTVRDFDDVQVAVVGPGELWQVYLASNATIAGTWRSLRYGVGTSTVDASSLAGTGIVAVGTLLSQSIPVTEINTSYTAGTQDRARMFAWTGTGGTLTLPSAAANANWFVYVRNSGFGALVVDPTGATLIDGSSTKSFQPGESAIVVSSGTSYYTIGFGKDAVFAFDYTSIDISGTGTYTLAGAELNRIAYSFTGTLTGNRQVIVPATVQQYWIGNETTAGPYTVQLKTAAGTGITLASNERAILFCDGTNVVNAVTIGISVPLLVNQGGTGATTSAGARINLGATALGDALFTAASSAVAYSALGVAPAGVVQGGAF